MRSNYISAGSIIKTLVCADSSWDIRPNEMFILTLPNLKFEKKISESDGFVIIFYYSLKFDQIKY